MTPFGAQLIGQTEKALRAVLRGIVTDVPLHESEWVALRVASHFDGDGSVAEFIGTASHLPDADAIVADLERRGLLGANRLTEAGQTCVATVAQRIAELTDPVWASVDPDDAETAGRVLNDVLDQLGGILRRDTT